MFTPFSIGFDYQYGPYAHFGYLTLGSTRNMHARGAHFSPKGERRQGGGTGEALPCLPLIIKPDKSKVAG